MSEIDNFVTVADMDDLVGNASIHLECESLTISIILPLNGPSKSMCNLTQDCDDHFHGLVNA